MPGGGINHYSDYVLTIFKYSFGKNTKPLQQLPRIIDSIKEALDNRILAALAIAALFSMIAGAISEPGWLGWVQGFSIYIGIFLIVSISAINDYNKDKNFVKLNSEVKKDRIGVIRGKLGVTQTVSIYKLVVGDIVLLEPGCMVPADCVLVEGEDIICDESKYSDDKDKTRKKVASEDNISHYPDPFLLSNSFVIQGNAKAVVCVVGDKSRRGSHEEKLDTDSKTPLQVRLERLGAQATKLGIQASAAILVASLLNFSMGLIF